MLCVWIGFKMKAKHLNFISALRVIVPAVIVAGILLYKFVIAPQKN